MRLTILATLFAALASSRIPADDALLRWSFDGDTDAARLTSQGVAALEAAPRGKPQLEQPGPRPSEYPNLPAANTALRLPSGANYLAVKDPGENSPLDFTNGDAITLECWLRWDEPLQGTYPYLIGKGRTHAGPGTKSNQNYALRLANTKAGVFPSFLFADAETAAKGELGENDWHRWTGVDAIPDDGAWHHVAVTYQFGKPDSLRAYIDGYSVKGKWESAGATDKAPVVDDDDLWIGSALAGRSTFNGFIDEVVVHRRAVPAEEFKQRIRINVEASGDAIGNVDPAAVPADRVRIEIVEGVPVARSWKFRVREPKLLYETDLFALKELPRKYDRKGLIVDRKVPALIHLATKVDLPAGEHEFIVRSLDSARLYVDGELRAETAFMGLNGDAHGPYYNLPRFGPELLSIAAGHSEQRVTLTLDAGPHVVSLYRLVGNKGKGDYLGEVCVGVGPPGGPYRFLSPTRELPFTDDGWLTFLAEHETDLRDWEQQTRLAISRDEQEYWRQRHDYARSVVESPGTGATGRLSASARAEGLSDSQGPAASATSTPARADEPPVPPDGVIDRIILDRLTAESKQPQPLTGDLAFLRRVTLDVTGLIPTPEQVERFFADPPETRRALAIDRLLADPAWADHWVGYWQDVLAENPGLTKPELNNTGPFRWFIYESMLDDKPLDRFVTELTMMEGSPYDGGPAGFGLASQADVPMAAKAHVLGTAFLAVEMKCARCHDAPYHDVRQEDLFNLAAMLKRAPQDVPGTSSIPLSPEQIARMQVKVTLPPGSTVKPAWPFVELLDDVERRASSVEKDSTTLNAQPSTLDPLPAALLRSENDTRELLAAQITSPHNTRFARVIANRVWQRYLGRALIEPVDDWEESACSHPELLDWLAREFVANGYDLKHLARLILNSQTYQRQAIDAAPESEETALFAGPVRRRMTGEQLADSLHLAVGKGYDSEELTMDRDGRQSLGAFTHLRLPSRAWQFVAVSNERDRPSLNLPVAQSLVDLLAAYGWRMQRQDPLTTRENALTPLTPMALAHGSAASRVIDFSDQSALTRLALEDQPVERFVERLFERILTRTPTTDEREAFVALLVPGYDARIAAGPEAVHSRRLYRSGVTWANHFDPKSDDEAIARQREVLEGDPPTARLTADWRTRAEDAAWVLVNLPEFVFVP